MTSWRVDGAYAEHQRTERKVESVIRTLADMTPEERAECVGMWCNIGPHEPGIDAGSYLFVLRSSSDYRGAQHAKLLDPISGVSEYISFKNVTLRHDLPRAWNPDGTPLAGEWSYANDVLGEFGNISEDEVQEFLADGDASFKRRWVGEWEPLP